VLLSRSGYTGEFGFELFLPPERLVEAWEMLLAAGEPYGALPCGLAARDSLRTGAVLPLSHQDNGNWRYINNPWPMALPFNDDRSGFTKDFLGRNALVCTPPSSWTCPYVGFDVRKVGSGESPAVVVNGNGKVIGIVLTCVTDVAVGWHEGRIYSITSPDRPAGFIPKGLSCGFVKVHVPLSAGDRLVLKDRKREIPVMVVNDIRPDRTARIPVSTMLARTMPPRAETVSM
jgi:aminomethyltransferase